ncbi:hypothetical protein COK06_04030 [Bacillus cereus]|uniref:hypothetical protein n=1 Tax=Bacillus nitratireducens TaxID=2026193 RepID=UPI0009ADB2DC|nr:hypothetical protein CON40_00710 [Bacillus cereus]PEU01460.1 hypothetical protein CN527_11110 [Bacillus cereus]PEV98281.1 hypothetical protein CN428_23275 [Bacillus cereus]PEZ93179.1 hypothetical protein CN374_03980 [Bacillus cereus]PFA35647.1 hypothetical protein CN390_03610 [Bacillus cereus]
MRKWLKKLFSKKRPPCIVCEEQEGELHLKETNWIFENCAQITHEQGIEIDTYTLLHLIP